MSPFTVRRIGHLVLRVVDPDRSMTFYELVLGLPRRQGAPRFGAGALARWGVLAAQRLAPLANTVQAPRNRAP